MACEVNNKEINSQCAELLVRPTYIAPSIIGNLIVEAVYRSCLLNSETL